MNGADWTKRLSLMRHPEGGWFRRIYTSEEQVRVGDGERPALTSIHYLLTQQQPIGRLHRNRSDILHYLQHGGPVEYLLLSEDGALRRVVLGYEPGQTLFLHVPGVIWKATRLLSAAEHVLISEAVMPGFTYTDHEFATPALLERFPAHAELLAPFIAEQEDVAAGRLGPKPPDKR